LYLSINSFASFNDCSSRSTDTRFVVVGGRVAERNCIGANAD
jgi:hypothetical protein